MKGLMTVYEAGLEGSAQTIPATYYVGLMHQCICGG